MRGTALGGAERARSLVLARAVHSFGLCVDDVTAYLSGGGRDAMAVLAEAAGVSAGDAALWREVEELLRRMRAWSTANPHASHGQRPAEPVPVEAAPKGWVARVIADGVLEAVCEQGPCRALALVNTPDGWRCPAHPPLPDQGWGAGLDWSPRPCTAPLRCYCGRHDSAASLPPAAADAVAVLRATAPAAAVALPVAS